MDQALWKTNPNGQRVLGYGGDFNERQTDYAFSGNGIVSADGTEKPAMQEVRYWYAGAEAREKWDAANRAAEAAAALPAYGEKQTPLRVTHGDGALGVRGEDFEILFSLPEGGPVSLRSGGREWFWRAPRPAYWRAPTENDIGNGFAANCSVWAAADLWQQSTGFEIKSESSNEVSVCYTYTAAALPGLRTDITYRVTRSGWLTVTAQYHGGAGRPELPLFGVRFAVPEPVASVNWLGLSGETYPDRKRGGRFGWHQEIPHLPGYLVPQECGCHMDTRAVCFRCRDGAALAMEMADVPFAFSALPYTPQQLEQAAHREELPLPVRTVITVCGAMRGVGGIDSWGTDVEPAYHVQSDQDLKTSFRIRL